MNVALDIQNADESLVDTLKSVIKLCPKAKFKIKKEENQKTLKAINEAESMLKSGNHKTYNSLEEYNKAMGV